jgi:hypothetical protein
MAVTVDLSWLKGTVGILLDDENATVYSAARKTRVINMAINHTQDILDSWGGKALIARTTISLVADTREYALAKEVKAAEKITFLRTAGDERQIRTISFVDVERYQNDAADPDVSGVNGPLYVYKKGLFLGFLPTPSVAGTAYLYHTSMQDDMVSDGDALVLPPWCRDMICFKAASYLASTRGDDKQKRLLEADYHAIYSEKQIQFSQWQKQDPDQVSQHWNREFGVPAYA